MRSVNHRNDPSVPRAAADHRSLRVAPVGDDSRLRRAIDIGVAMAATVLLSPLLALIALLIKLDSPGPVLYGQQRVGKNGLPSGA
jgi:lipopolysaccharide/colanic/teichoic acid biosynthesis glycosyltransferase